MKTLIGCLALTMPLLISSCSGKLSTSKVPEPVKKTFAAQFPGAGPTWEKEDGNYEASFVSQGHEMSAVFDQAGTMLESETEIPVADLPTEIKSYLDTKLNKPVIKEAAKITMADGKIRYEANIKGKDIILETNGTTVTEVAGEK